MKRTAWIFVALCLVFVLSISAIAATTGGARYRHREHLDTWYDTAELTTDFVPMLILLICTEIGMTVTWALPEHMLAQTKGQLST